MLGVNAVLASDPQTVWKRWVSIDEAAWELMGASEYNQSTNHTAYVRQLASAKTTLLVPHETKQERRECYLTIDTVHTYPASRPSGNRAALTSGSPSTTLQHPIAFHGSPSQYNGSLGIPMPRSAPQETMSPQDTAAMMQLAMMATHAQSHHLVLPASVQQDVRDKTPPLQLAPLQQSSPSNSQEQPHLAAAGSSAVQGPVLVGLANHDRRPAKKRKHGDSSKFDMVRDLVQEIQQEVCADFTSMNNAMEEMQKLKEHYEAKSYENSKEQELEKFRSENISLRTRLENAIKKITEQSTSGKLLQEQHQKLQEKHQNLQEKYQKLEEQHQKSQEQHQFLHVEHQNLQHEAAQLRSKVQKLESKKAALAQLLQQDTD